MSKRDGRRPPLRDWHLWSEVARSVRPLAARRPAATPREPNLSSAPAALEAGRQKNPPPAPAHKPARPAPRAAAPPDAEKPLEPRMRRRLMRGQLPIDATIDLHGMRQAEAQEALSRFVIARHARGDRTLLVITGKGLKKTGFGRIEQHGVLRNMLPLWLNTPMLAPLVAGWQVAAQAHGGEGAYYLRLKRGKS